MQFLLRQEPLYLLHPSIFDSDLVDRDDSNDDDDDDGGNDDTTSGGEVDNEE
jgi:hypothetical protein